MIAFDLFCIHQSKTIQEVLIVFCRSKAFYSVMMTVYCVSSEEKMIILSRVFGWWHLKRMIANICFHSM